MENFINRNEISVLNRKEISEFFINNYSFLLQKDWCGIDYNDPNNDPKLNFYFGDGALEIGESDALIYIFQAEWLKSRFFRKTLRKLISYDNYDSMYLKNRYLFAKKTKIIPSFPLLMPIIKDYFSLCLFNIFVSLSIVVICSLLLNIGYNFSWNQIIMFFIMIGFILSCMRTFGYLVDFLNTFLLRIRFQFKMKYRKNNIRE